MAAPGWVESASRLAAGSAARVSALALNHLLDQHAWARERLAPFAGRTLTYRSPPLPAYRLCILESGRVEPQRPERPGATQVAPEAAPEPQGEPAAADVVVTLKPGIVPFLVRRRLDLPLGDTGSAFEITGAEDLAVAVSELMLHLDWDAEEDLSMLVGDVAAHRIAGAGRELLAWQKEAAQRFARSFAEYWTEEKAVLPGRGEFDAFRSEIERIDARLAGIEARIEALRPRDPPR
ncbi:MAG: hypothetical protein IT514_12185 [Burkholderiales bacterium]|nr:hypothetical protein [Burkholderiales bacterium]